MRKAARNRRVWKEEEGARREKQAQRGNTKYKQRVQFDAIKWKMREKQAEVKRPDEKRGRKECTRARLCGWLREERREQSERDARVPATDGMGDIKPGHHGYGMIGDWPGLHHRGCGRGWGGWMMEYVFPL